LGGNIDTRRSTIGYIFLLEGIVVSWASKKQAIIALCFMEVKYIVSTQAMKGVL
jgi:hypothetical protein